MKEITEDELNKKIWSISHKIIHTIILSTGINIKDLILKELSDLEEEWFDYIKDELTK